MTKVIIQIKDGQVINIGANTDQVLVKIMDMDQIENDNCVPDYDDLDYLAPNMLDFDIDHIMRKEWDEAFRQSGYFNEDCDESVDDIII